MISIRNITKQFPSVTALDDVSLEIGEEEFFGLLGPNGAGKTTLMNLLVGYLNPESGTITVGGERVTRDSLDVRKTIGFVPQSLALYDDLSARANLEMFGRLFGLPSATLKERIDKRLNAVGLYERRNDNVKTFSGGMKRRLNIIASLLHDPQVLLCDEPTVGVDPQSRNAIFDFLESLNAQGKTVIYTTHYMEEAERLCSRIAIIDHGKIIASGTSDELIDLLPYEETIIVAKNPTTMEHKSALAEFGTVIENDDHMLLKPDAGFAMSTFFKRVEQKGMKYRWFEIHRPTLEELFLHMTGRRLRD
jgi:ABC-2 type transport system ATP-binding protein